MALPAEAQARRRFHDFQDLMRRRVMDILLVSSPYDRFILEEAGELSERMLGEFRNLDLHYRPGLTGVSTGEEALELLRREPRFNLVLTTPHIGDMRPAELVRRLKQDGRDVPVVLLAYGSRELEEAADLQRSGIERVFLWQGDAQILVGIVKSVEDRLNVAADTASVGVQVIILVEDNVRYYSSFLGAIYTELFHHAQRLIEEGANLSHKILRVRARPKILLCSTFEEAWEAFSSYQNEVLGVISDIEFPRAGRRDVEAGVELARRVRERVPDVPVILQSSREENRERAWRVGAEFLLKGPLLLNDLRRFMLQSFGFGDFVFRQADGSEVGRAADLLSLEQQLASVPEESIAYHAERNHFSRWLKARTEFALAYELRPRKLADFPSVGALRRSLIDSIARYRSEQAQSVVADFDRSGRHPELDFSRVGSGSLGGKARGLAFVRRLIGSHGLRHRFPGVEVVVPEAVVVCTEVFDRFLEDNGLRDFAVEERDDREIERRLLAARFPEEARLDLEAFLERAPYPLAVRSSSLLEDSQYQPFTGVYDTLMLPNQAWSVAERLEHVLRAVKRVYASTFTRNAKSYLAATPYRLEEEKMAVIVQRIVGAHHGTRYYPDFSGVARSHNFYPTPPLAAGDGIAAVALGLGRTVAEGGRCLRFSPRHPRHLLQLATAASALETTQRDFWALDLTAAAEGPEAGMRETRFELASAEADGTLVRLASTYSRENDALYDGLGRPGVRVVSFAPVLKQGVFPLPEILSALLEVGAAGMSAPVELEFAVSLRPGAGPHEFGVLQMRPLAPYREADGLEIGEVSRDRLLCFSSQVLGNGRLEGLRDVVFVDFQRFERARSREAAQEVARLNAELAAASVPYVLIGVGRWGSRDPWLGIPVTWDQVSSAAVIVEAGLRDVHVAPSQGTHFFQNLTSFNVGYFTVNPEAGDGFLDWGWLDAQQPSSHAAHVRHLRLAQPLLVKMNGKRNEGVIFKPGEKD